MEMEIFVLIWESQSTIVIRFLYLLKKNNNTISFDFEYLKIGYALNVGNPHLVFFVEQLNKNLLEKNSKEIENLEFFPEGVNISIVKIINKQLVKIMTHERGVGVTQACGSAACASVLIAKEKDSCYR